MNFLIKIILIKLCFYLIHLSNGQICGNKEPLNTSDCSFSSYEDQACCFINYNETIRGCLFVPQNSTFITPYITSLNFGLDNLFSIKIDCGKDEQKAERLCRSNPKIEEDCFMLSNSTHDCCYFQTPRKETFCLWNPVKQRKNSNIFGTNIKCFRDAKGLFIARFNIKYVLFTLFILFIF